MFKIIDQSNNNTSNNYHENDNTTNSTTVTTNLPLILISEILYQTYKLDVESNFYVKFQFKLISKKINEIVTNRFPFSLEPLVSKPFTLESFNRVYLNFNSIISISLGADHRDCVDSLITFIPSKPTMFEQLQQLKLYYNQPESAIGLANIALQYCPNLTRLQLPSCSLEYHHLQRLTQSLAKSNLKFLSLISNQNVFDDGDSSQQNENNDNNGNNNYNDFFSNLPETMLVLDLGACGLAYDTIKSLVESPFINKLKSLVLSFNMITEDCQELLAGALARPDIQLENLHLDYCSLGSGVISIGEALRNNNTLRYISLEFNNIRQHMGEQFLQLLEQAQSTKSGIPLKIHSEMNHWQLTDEQYKRDYNQIPIIDLYKNDQTLIIDI